MAFILERRYDHPSAGASSPEDFTGGNRVDQGDFFISYCQRDRDWAEWIAWQLQEVGYRVFLQAWHIGPGRNWVRDMGQGMENCRHTIAVLSPEYLNSPYCRAEWQAAFEYDPEGNLRKLIPVRIAECTPTGMLRQVVHFDLIGIDDEDAAREELLRNVRSAWEKEGGLAPKKRPGFPPAQGTRTEPPEPDPAGTPGTPAAVTPDTGLTLPLPPTQRPITSRPTFPPEVAGWRRAARALRTALTRGWVVLPTLAAAIVIGIAFQVADGGPGGVLVGSLVAALAAAAPAFMLFPPTDRTATLVVGGACVVGALGGAEIAHGRAWAAMAEVLGAAAFSAVFTIAMRPPRPAPPADPADPDPAAVTEPGVRNKSVVTP
ncbi:Toll-Interleukin receptor [Frankia casuarinae]|uniref:Toll-Interleukin receptor n=1 Tax=Frankia casuarinae (strain DSM 45818 / CECT 9043 / HFP020203 / CcI3) TaxID=106370 RepID=Q2J8P0_FRACC|nr:Toll-Interleukin receptor [Frankia casuarinae]